MTAHHTFFGKPCALCGRTHRVSSVPKLRGAPKPPQPRTHRIIDPEDVTTVAVLRGVVRAYVAFMRSGCELRESEAHDDAVRMAAELIGEPFFGMNDMVDEMNREAVAARQGGTDGRS